MTSSSVEPAVHPKRRSVGRRVARRALPLIVIVGLLGLWQGASVLFHIQPFLVPSPTTIAKALWEGRAQIGRNMIPTIEEAAAGFIIGNAVALLLATWFVHVRTARQAIYPLAIVIQSIPLVALAPVFVITLGTGFASKVAMTGLISFFPTLVNATRGLDAVERPLVELFQSVDSSKRDVFFKLRLPNALPYVFLGLRITASASIIGAIIAEWIGADKGLGFLVINTTYEFDTPMLWASLVASAALVLCAFGLVGLVERIVVPWQASVSAQGTSEGETQ